MYSMFNKLFKISQYAFYSYGEKISLEQLKTSITMIIQTVDERTINKYIGLVTKDFSPIITPQFKKEGEAYFPMPNRPKSGNQLIGEAFKKTDLNELGRRAKEDSS